jgi:hypothetical protein
MIYLVTNLEDQARKAVLMDWMIRDMDPNCPLHARLLTTGLCGRFEGVPEVRIELSAPAGCVIPEVYVRGTMWVVSERIQRGLREAFGDGLNHVEAEFRRGGGAPDWKPYLVDTRWVVDVVDWRKSDYFVMPSGDRVLNLERVVFRRSAVPDGPAVFRARDYPALLFANGAGRERMLGCGMGEGFFRGLPLGVGVRGGD